MKWLCLFKTPLDTFTANFYRGYGTCNSNISVAPQWLSGRVLDSRPRCRGLTTTGVTALWSLSKVSKGARHIYPSLVLVQPRKTHPCLTERLLMGRKESNQTNKQTKPIYLFSCLKLALPKVNISDPNEILEFSLMVINI